MHKPSYGSVRFAPIVATMAAAAVVVLATAAHEARADALVYGCLATTEQPIFAQASGFCQFPAFGQTAFCSATAALPGGVLRADASGKSITTAPASGPLRRTKQFLCDANCVH